MSLNTSATSEYFEVHQHALSSLTEGISRILSEGADIIIEQDGPNNDTYLVTTPYTPEFILEATNASLSDEDAVEMARIKNQAQLSVAELDFLALQAMATFKMVAENVETFSDENPPTMLRYEKGRNMISFRQNLILSATHLIGIEAFGSTSKFSLTHYDQLTTRQLQVMRLGDTIQSVDYSIKPIEDIQVQGWSKLFRGEHFASILNMLSARFKTEEELDDSISEVWSHFIGTAQEEEVGPLLDQIRIRAIATKDSIHLNDEFLLDLPSAEQLSEVISEISQL
jgi:hypothetical protein